MLEALHLTKIYKTKGGADVRALDDISIQFPEKGMVFLLGRSGSGKSTLLNVCGGLDAPTSGEVIVKGRSSKSFSQSDFDSYRNTFVGFIFQEYNILNEFSVEDNIALALELQGKSKDKKVIADLLEQVDLTGYAKRKPNTLSGGQKQRIAIARALVKSPEIIMADEPTGALDSATGKQVFDTLKKLSKDKLVIVVSHDRDFAEQYGDRIVELQDGKVISDVTKTHEQQQELSENISVVGDTLCVKKGSELNEKDFEEIKAFLSKADTDVIIASGEKDVKTFKEVSHIKDNGEKEVFRNSAETPIERKMYTPRDSRFIRSKLPARHAFKIGISSLKTKPIRLFFTILLCTVAFIFFGLLSTMTFYDSEATFKESLKDSNYELVQLGKRYQITEKWYMDGEMEYEYTYNSETKFTEADLAEYAKTFGKDAFGAVQVWENLRLDSNPSDYWNSQISYFAYLSDTNSLRERINGKYPEKADEICISTYVADMIYNCRVSDKETGELLELSKPEDVIGKKLTIAGTDYTVTGIIDSGEISAKYDVIKNGETENYQLIMGLHAELQDGLHQVVFVNSENLAEVAEMYSYSMGMDVFYTQRMVAVLGNAEGKYTFPEWANAGYGAFSKHAEDTDVISVVSGKTTPGDDEAVISPYFFYELVMNVYAEKMDTAIEAGDADAEKSATDTYEIVVQLYNGGYEEFNKKTEEIIFHEFTKAEVEEKQNALIAAMQKDNVEITIATKLFDDMDAVSFGELETYRVVGIWKNGGDYESQILLSDKEAERLWAIQKDTLTYYSEYFTAYKEPEDAIYQTVFLPYDHSDTQTNLLWDMYNNGAYGEDDSRTTLTSTLTSTLETVDMVIETLSKVFLWVGIVLAVFAALLLSNFISVSISYKKKEIGILRAVGARSLDVFKIFFSESFVITAICVVLSVIGSVACCSIINGIVASIMSATLFVFGIASFAVLLVIAFITVVVATFLPVWNAAKKKPVESIRAL